MEGIISWFIIGVVVLVGGMASLWFPLALIALLFKAILGKK